MPPKKVEEEIPLTGARFGRVKNNLKVRCVGGQTRVSPTGATRERCAANSPLRTSGAVDAQQSAGTTRPS
jgi:hypothetical protein